MNSHVMITDWPGYAATRSGSIISLQRIVKGKCGPRIHKPRTLIPYGVGIKYRYLAVTLCQDGKIRRARVHQLIAAAFIGPCPPGHEVDHIDGNPKNNRAINLRYLPISVNRGLRHGR